MMPRAPKARTNSSATSCGWISQYTLASRTRRAISCVYCAPKSRIRILWCTPRLFHPVVGRFLHDLHVVHVRFAHAGGGDLHELRLAAQLLHRGAAGVTHAGAHAAGELLDHPHRAALVGHAPLDAL